MHRMRDHPTDDCLIPVSFKMNRRRIGINLARHRALYGNQARNGWVAGMWPWEKTLAIRNDTPSGSTIMQLSAGFFREHGDKRDPGQSEDGAEQKGVVQADQIGDEAHQHGHRAAGQKQGHHKDTVGG